MNKSAMQLLLTILLIDFFAMFVTAESTAVVNTTNGPVQGEIRTTVNSVKYAVFLGMRYGKAPIGDLRFKPPVVPDPWTEVLNATAEGNECIQYDPLSMKIHGSEDCLFINVYTPEMNLTETPTKLKSVIFWIYGGAFLVGPPSITFGLSPDYFIDNDIVFVSVNYRAGIFGFLALGLANATGNAGLKDLVLGLRWVQGNIEKFGGNPNNVTILGASTGAAAVQYIMVSDSAAGLFHGAISMSGTALSTWAFQTPAKSLSQAERLGKAMGITWTDNESLFEAFFTSSAEQIVNATTKLAVYFGPFTPTIEDPSIATDIFLSDCFVDKYKRGNFTKVPQLLGYSDQETVVFVADFDPIRELIEKCFDAADALHLTLPPSIISTKNRIDSSKDYYENWDYDEIQKFVDDTSNLLYIAPLDDTQKMIVSKNDRLPVFYYHLSYYAPGSHSIAPNNTLPGAGHGDDLVFIFYSPVKNFSDPPTLLTINRMSTMWSNFVKYGNPTPDWVNDNSLNFTWPDSGHMQLSLKIGSELTIDPSPISKDAKSLQKMSHPFLREAFGCE